MIKKMDKLRRNFLWGADDERDDGRAPRLHAMRLTNARGSISESGDGGGGFARAAARRGQEKRLLCRHTLLADLTSSVVEKGER